MTKTAGQIANEVLCKLSDDEKSPVARGLAGGAIGGAAGGIAGMGSAVHKGYHDPELRKIIEQQHAHGAKTLKPGQVSKMNQFGEMGRARTGKGALIGAGLGVGLGALSALS
jgi:hypothetical protein